MIYRKSNSRPRNWRASRKNQLFCTQRHFRLLEKMFWYYNKIKLAVKEEQAERAVYLSASSTDAIGRSSGSISNPTERNAFKQMEKIKAVVISKEKPDCETIENPQDWLKVVDKTLEYFDNNDKMVWEILTRRYLKNEGSPATCIDLEINANKYYKARDAGLQYARECAIQLELLKAFEK